AHVNFAIHEHDCDGACGGLCCLTAEVMFAASFEIVFGSRFCARSSLSNALALCVVRLRQERQELLSAEQRSAVSCCPPFAEAVEGKVNDRRSVEGKRLTKDETADYRYAERSPELGAHPGRYDQWQRTEQGRRCRH